MIFLFLITALTSGDARAHRFYDTLAANLMLGAAGAEAAKCMKFMARSQHFGSSEDMGQLETQGWNLSFRGRELYSNVRPVSWTFSKPRTSGEGNDQTYCRVMDSGDGSCFRINASLQSQLYGRCARIVVTGQNSAASNSAPFEFCGSAGNRKIAVRERSTAEAFGFPMEPQLNLTVPAIDPAQTNAARMGEMVSGKIDQIFRSMWTGPFHNFPVAAFRLACQQYASKSAERRQLFCRQLKAQGQACPWAEAARGSSEPGTGSSLEAQ